MEDRSFRRSENITMRQDEVIGNKELPIVLKHLESESIAHMKAGNYAVALTYLKRTEEIIESVTTQGGLADKDIVLSVIHNMAVCFGEIQDIPRCLQYVEACLYNAGSDRLLRPKIGKTEWQIRRHKYMCKLSLVSSTLLTQSSSNSEALKKAKSAYFHSISALTSTCQSLKRAYIKANCTKSKLHIPKKMQVVERVYPTVLALKAS